MKMEAANSSAIINSSESESHTVHHSKAKKQHPVKKAARGGGAHQAHKAGHTSGQHESHEHHETHAIHANQESHEHHDGHEHEAGAEHEESSDDGGPARFRQTPAKKTATRRVNLALNRKLYQQIEKLADERGESITSLLREGLSLALLAHTEHARGGRLAVIDRDGTLHFVIIANHV